MSKLSAVRTGQPTQGVGAAPSQQPPAAERAMRAQEVVAESAAHSLSAQVDAAPINPRSAHSAAAATVAAAWLSLEAKEIEVRQYFHKLPVASGLEMLARMRKQCDLAAGVLQQRIDQGATERCTGCGKTLEEARKSQFIMQGSEVDPETGVPIPYRFCSPICVRERNREKMLPPESRNKYRFDGTEEGDIR